jgi:hypothetical protein
MKNEPTRHFEEIFKNHNDPSRVGQRLMVKKREEVKQEKEFDYCLAEKNEEQRNYI